MLRLCSCGTLDKKDDESKKTEYQLLLLGTDESGKVSIIEKFAALQNQFTHQARIDRIPHIKCHIRDSMTSILYTFNKLIPSIKLEHPENQWRATYILTTAQETDFNYPAEFFEHVAILWADANIKLCLEGSIQYEFIDSTKHFFNRVNQIKEADYIPTDQDMIHSRFFKSHTYEMSFDFTAIRYRLFEVDLLRDDRRKWVHCFSDVIAIIFVVDCSNFDLESTEYNFRIDLFESIAKFRMMMANNWLRTKPVILLLNKEDILTKRIKNGSRIENYFHKHFGSHVSQVETVENDLDEDEEVNRAKHLIKNKFLDISIGYGMKNHRCYLEFISDNDTRTTRWIFDICRIIIMKQYLQRYDL